MKNRFYVIASIILFISRAAHAQIPFNCTVDFHANSRINYTITDTFAYLGLGTVDTGGNNYNISTTKYNWVGSLLWARNYGPGIATAGAMNHQGYLIAAASTVYSTSGDTNIVLTMTDRSGNVLWAKNYGGDSTFVPTYVLTVPAPYAGFLITGRTTGFGSGGDDMLLMKVDTAGNLQWQHAYGSTGYETGNNIFLYPDTTLYIVGTSNGGGARDDIFFVHTDINGNPLSQYLIGTPGNEEGEQIWPYSDSILYVLGNTSNGIDSSEDILLMQVKIRGQDSILWARTIGDSGIDQAVTVEGTPQGGGNLVIVCGSTSSYGDSMQGFAVLADTLGNIEGALAFGDTGNDYITDARITNNGLLMAGYSNSYTSTHYNTDWVVEVDGLSTFATCNDSIVNPMSQTPVISLTGPAPPGFSSVAGNISTSAVSITAWAPADTEWANCYILIPLEAALGYNKSICVGDSVNIGGNPTAQYGVPPYRYRWAPTTGLSNDTIANPYASPNSYTTYSVTVTDSIGETATASISVSVSSCQPLVLKAGDDTLLCNGQSLVLGGNPTVTGGNPPYHYQWSPSTGLSNDTVANPTVTPTASIIYTVTVTDAFNGTTSASIQITVSTCTQISVNAGDDTTLCPNQKDTLGGHPSASGGTPPYTYLWQPSTGLSSDTVPNPLATPYADTSVYVLTVTDAESLYAIDTVILYSSTCTGITDNDMSYAADIYPNPNHGTFEIHLTHGPINIQSIKVTDVTGRIVYNGEHQVGSDLKITLDRPAQGCYLIEMKTVSGFMHTKIVVE